MKQLMPLLLMICVFGISTQLIGQSQSNKYSKIINGKYISMEEKIFLTNYLQQTQSDLTETIYSLSDQEWAYRPEDGGWTIKECLEHIIQTEVLVFEQIKKALKEPADPAQSTKQLDAWLIAKVSDRGVKVKTPLPQKPSQKTKADLLSEFEKSRPNIAQFLEKDKMPLRAHFGKSPYGPADAYQLFLVISAHTMRHHHQIIEILNEVRSTEN